jgi:hypothetical protein
MGERREHHTRAETLRRVVAWLQRQTTPAARIPADVAGSAAGTRILKQLALRCLARRGTYGWMPTPILLAGIALCEPVAIA